jgi:hypothetical protein
MFAAGRSSGFRGSANRGSARDALDAIDLCFEWAPTSTPRTRTRRLIDAHAKRGPIACRRTPRASEPCD